MIYQRFQQCLRLASLFWPKFCTFCHSHTTLSLDVCHSCLDALPFTQAAQTPEITDFAAFHYHFPVDRLVQDLKFKGRLTSGRVLGELFAGQLQQYSDPVHLPDILIPMPLHPKRVKTRGFNQSEIIAKPISQALHIPMETQLCQRVIHTAEQSKLDKLSRKQNLVNAFRVNPKRLQQLKKSKPQLHVAIIDDVSTTGSTLMTLKEALTNSGVTRISCWAVCQA